MLILDGPVGTELAARGIATPPPLWSAHGVVDAQDGRDARAVLAQIHRDYAAAGATVHTAATFRTTRRAAGAAWETMLRSAVRIARDAVPRAHRVAGSVAPLEDCYRPDLSPSPAEARAEHAAMARALVDAGVDLLLCETFPNAQEAVIAVEACAATGRETWVALTAGPDASLMTPEAMAIAARACVDAGACAVLVNCVPASRTLPYVIAIAEAGVPFGAYANAGAPSENIGWSASADPSKYVEYARMWIDAGASIVGGCCGTSPAHIAALAKR